MGFTSDITEYQKMLRKYEKRGDEMQQARLGRDRKPTGRQEPKRKSGYYISVNGVDMSRDEYATYAREMYEANGEDYPGQMFESMSTLYGSPV